MKIPNIISYGNIALIKENLERFKVKSKGFGLSQEVDIVHVFIKVNWLYLVVQLVLPMRGMIW